MTPQDPWETRTGSAGRGRWGVGRWVLLLAALAMVGTELFPARAASAPVEALGHNVAMSALVEACGTLAEDRFPVSPCGHTPIFTDTNIQADLVLVDYIDRAQASAGQPSFVLPRGFFALTAGEQIFVLANLLRLANGVPPVPYFAGGWLLATVRFAARHQIDPTDQTGAGDARPYWERGYGSNWFSGSNPLLAFGMWAYDDGAGSTNLACTPRNPSGCWGHRRVLLWQPTDRAVYLFAAACSAGCTSKVVQARPGGGYGRGMVAGRLAAQPVLYTWKDALRAGARLAPRGFVPPLPLPPVRSARVVFRAGVKGVWVDGRLIVPGTTVPRVTLTLAHGSVVMTTTTAQVPPPPLPAPVDVHGVLYVPVRGFLAALGTTSSLSARATLRFFGARGPVNLSLSRHGIERAGHWWASAARLGALAGGRVSAGPDQVAITFGRSAR